MTTVLNNDKYKISNEFETLTNKLIENMGIGICDEYVYNTIAKCGFLKYEKLLNFTTGQISALSIDPTYSMYTVDIFTKTAAHHIDLKGDIQGNYYSSLQVDDKHIIFNCLNLESLMNFLLENTKDTTKYIFIPVVYGSMVHDHGHFSVLTFDVILKQVYFVDPNGNASFFNNILYKYLEKNPEMKQYVNSEDMYIDTEELVEKIFEMYIGNFNNLFGENYKFVKRDLWNPTKCSINKNYDNTLIKSGHCVCVSTLMVDYLMKTYETPENLVNMLKKLSNDEIIELINAYSIGMYNILTNY